MSSTRDTPTRPEIPVLTGMTVPLMTHPCLNSPRPTRGPAVVPGSAMSSIAMIQRPSFLLLVLSVGARASCPVAGIDVLPREIPTAGGAGLGQLLGMGQGSLHVPTFVVAGVRGRVRRGIRIFNGLRGWGEGTGRAMIEGGVGGLDVSSGRVRWRRVLD